MFHDPRGLTQPPASKPSPVIARLQRAFTLLCLLCLCLAASLPPAAQEQKPAAPIVNLVDGPQTILRDKLFVLEDPGRHLDAEAAQTALQEGRFTAQTGRTADLNFGYSRSAFWVAIPLRSEKTGNYLLELQHPSLDRAELYQRGQNGFLRQVAGDMQAVHTRPFDHRNLVFQVPLKAGDTTTLLLRVMSEGSLSVPLILWEPSALHAHDQQTYGLLFLYYGILLALFIYNLMLYVSLREPLYLVYVMCVFSMGLGQASLNGLGNQMLWPGMTYWGNVALPVTMAASGLFGAQFVRQFLATPGRFKFIDRMLLGWMMLFALSITLVLAFDYRMGAILTSLTGMGFSLSAVVISVYCHRKGQRSARFLLLAWTVLLIGVAIQALRNLGWVPTNLFTQYAMQAGSSLDLLLLSFALADRIQSLRRAKESTDADLLANKQALVTALRKNEAELESKVAERTRDLQRANERLIEKEQQLEYMARHDSLTGLANRSLLAIRMEHSLARARRSGRMAAVLLVDVDNFKQLNDREGHLVGDHLLVKLAGRFTESVRMTDTVARYGGDEFVVVLEEVISEEQAMQVAMKLVHIAAEPVFMPSGKELQATVSIGMSYFPKDGQTAEELLRKADDAMFAAKSAGRNRWLAALSA